MPIIYSRSGWVCVFIRFGEMCLCISVSAMDALQWMGAVRMRVNGCSAVNGCRQNESQWMLCGEWVPSEWESMDALQWMGAVRMRVNGCSAVNGCRQNGVDYCDVFIRLSFWRHPFTAEHLFHQVMKCYISPKQMKNKMAWGCAIIQQI